MNRTNIRLKIIFYFAVLIISASFAPEIRAATFTVDFTSDIIALTACTSTANDCNLRGAILKANSTTDDDTIDFAIPANAVNCTASGICTNTLNGSQLTVDAVSTAGKLTINQLDRSKQTADFRQ